MSTPDESEQRQAVLDDARKLLKALNETYPVGSKCRWMPESAAKLIGALMKEYGMEADLEVAASRNSKKKAPQIEFKTYRDQCKAAGVQLIGADSAAVKYAHEIGLPREILELCWLEFRHTYENSNKRYASWPLAFANCVRNNWFKLWFFNNQTNTFELTTKGQQQSRIHKNNRASREQK